ncbi:cbb3-type cytochrome c oxidase N-terminal domain-containing protein [Saccharicrinis aurantiacus]|uniref:cbb3-type cytochrome c oxidase N-terminal domain-containing protein n=1 Tax=Saccharicrinis aurantiacus TaxID=1849719 RepID=UPI000838A585|nr:cbb3-type cytochrome c oxidase N-terminal domain-containing protein [Saccharicrinis aurantiacus]
MSQEVNIGANGFHDDIESHDYDGIKEQNNPAPLWITLLFLVTIGFSLFYTIHYFGYPGNGRGQDGEYAASVAAYEASQAELKEQNQGNKPELAMNDMVAKGKELYTKNACMACHGQSGEGNAIGPNLTDKFWINGCSEADIMKVISEGKPTKGMTPYKAMMSEDEIKYVANYILQELVGSSPANPKDPQGEECK